VHLAQNHSWPPIVLDDLSGGRVLSVNPDGSDKKVIATIAGGRTGAAVDIEAGTFIDQHGQSKSERRFEFSSARISMARIARRLFPKAARSPQNNSIAKRKAASSIGVIARGCESCARISMVQISKRWWTRARVKAAGKAKRMVHSITVDPTAAKSIGRKRDRQGALPHLSREYRNSERGDSRESCDIEILFDNLPNR